MSMSGSPRVSRDYARLTCEEAAARLRGGEDTLILLHNRPDGDAVGSAFGLGKLMEALGCRVLCACSDELPARLRFLIDDGCAQESIRYDRLPADFRPTQILSVDTASPTQMGAMFPLFGDRVDLMIDHHGTGEMYADGWIVGGASATGQLIYELALTLIKTGRIDRLPDGIHALLYAAISSDTGCFRFSNADPSAYRAAADLLEAGFDAATINHRLFVSKSRELLLAERIAYDRLHLFADGRIGIVDMPYALRSEHGLADEHMETLIEVPRSLEGVELAAAVREAPDAGVYRVSMRSATDVDVAAICASFGGGGHKKAAGCTVKCDGGIDAAVRIVAEKMEEAMNGQV